MALDLILAGLKERGYEVVPVSDLMGKTRADVMPPLSPKERVGCMGRQHQLRPVCRAVNASSSSSSS